MSHPLIHLFAALLLLTASSRGAASPSFEEFDRRARAGDRLNVVFFGASLTWGANATDPLLTSYRAQIARRMEARYPEAHFKFWDAAIGGTGSQLGVFRLDRDVLRHQPDLVFLDFSANDDIYSDNPESLASYEAILRRLVTEAKCPVVQVIFPFKWNVSKADTEAMKRRDAHLALSRAYRTAVGDAIALAIERVKDGTATLENLWPLDGVHPGNEGYALFADAAWTAFESAVREKQVCAAPEPMKYAGTYLRSARVPLVSLGALPSGWRAGSPNVTSAYFDFLMSRWLDNVAIASRPAAKANEPESPEPGRFRAQFHGSMVMLLGEATKTSGKYRVRIDGEIVRHTAPNAKTPIELFDPGSFAQKIGGSGHHAQIIATGLDPAKEHTLEIEPLLDPGQELRLESICVAGSGANVKAIAVQTH
jgi:lysophospholipase L1-like esterase